MTNPFEDTDARYLVVVNDEGHSANRQPASSKYMTTARTPPVLGRLCRT
jgi:hypothetical protein